MKKSKSAAKKGKFQKELVGLKQMMMSGDNFKDIYNHFFDVLGENPEFIRLSKRAKHPVLKKVVGGIGEHLFKKEVTVTHFMLMKLPKTKFYHGTCFMEGQVAGLFFFEDVDMGIFAVLTGPPNTLFVRFSTVTEHPGDTATLSPFRSNSIH